MCVCRGVVVLWCTIYVVCGNMSGLWYGRVVDVSVVVVVVK